MIPCFFFIALLLNIAGLDVCGIFMRNWDLRDEVGHCSSDADCDYATRVCQALNIPFHEVGFKFCYSF